MTTFNTTFNTIASLQNNEVLSNDLTKTQKKESFRCYILRTILGWCGVKSPDPAQYNMLKVAQNIHAFVSDKNNAQLFKQQGGNKQLQFQEKLRTLREKFDRAKDAQEGRQAVDKVNAAFLEFKRLITKPLSLPPESRAEAPKQSVFQALPQTPPLQGLAGRVAPTIPTKSAVSAIAKSNLANQPGFAQQAGVVAAISALHTTPGHRTVRTVVDPKDAANMERSKKEGRSGNLVHELRSKDPNAVFMARKVRQPRKETQVDEQAERTAFAVGARLAGAIAALRPVDPVK
jgi:hypothetical protein